MKIISLVIPCYNEAKTVFDFFTQITPVIAQLKNYRVEFVFVDDGSSDDTVANLISLKNNNIKIIQFSRNFGKEAALTAGIDHAVGDAVIPIDVDLQDPPELIIDMVEKWEQGYEMVLAKRVNRSSDSMVKKISANLFYKFHNLIAKPKIPQNVGDFRLMDRKVVEVLKAFPERQRFMKGLFAFVGFDTATVEFVRQPRVSGETKWNQWKLWNFALEGITSFSTVPLRLWSYLGGAIAIFSFFYGMWTLVKTLFYGIDVPGYASLLIVILFLGGIQLIGIGVIGEYLGRNYQESKQRPIYIVKKLHNFEEK